MYINGLARAAFERQGRKAPYTGDAGAGGQCRRVIIGSTHGGLSACLTPSMSIAMRRVYPVFSVLRRITRRLHRIANDMRCGESWECRIAIAIRGTTRRLQRDPANPGGSCRLRCPVGRRRTRPPASATRAPSTRCASCPALVRSVVPIVARGPMPTRMHESAAGIGAAPSAAVTVGPPGSSAPCPAIMLS